MRYEVFKYNRIRDLRVDNELTQGDIAKMLDITPSTISLFETGGTDILNFRLVKLAKFYNTSVDYLLGLTDIKDIYPIPTRTIKKPITRIRKLNNLFQTDLAQKIGVSQNTISSYELGKVNIPIDTLIQFALILNTSIDYILGLTDQDEPHERKGKSYRELVKKYS